MLLWGRWETSTIAISIWVRQAARDLWGGGLKCGVRRCRPVIIRMVVERDGRPLDILGPRPPGVSRRWVIGQGAISAAID